MQTDGGSCDTSGTSPKADVVRYETPLEDALHCGVSCPSKHDLVHTIGFVTTTIAAILIPLVTSRGAVPWPNVAG